MEQQEDILCPFCCESFEKIEICNNCKYKICIKCFDLYMKYNNKCPICRKTILKIENIIYFDSLYKMFFIFSKYIIL